LHRVGLAGRCGMDGRPVWWSGRRDRNRLWKRGEKKRTMGTYTYVYDEEGRREKNGRKEKIRVEKESGADT
jgi:hypothetical protein